MMHARHHRRAPALQAVDQRDVPERFMALHHRREDASGQLDQFGLTTWRGELCLVNVLADIKVRS
jgi:hypothetical protein